jgi:hypothetical protein
VKLDSAQVSRIFIPVKRGFSAGNLGIVFAFRKKIQSEGFHLERAPRPKSIAKKFPSPPPSNSWRCNRAAKAQRVRARPTHGSGCYWLAKIDAQVEYIAWRDGVAGHGAHGGDRKSDQVSELKVDLPDIDPGDVTAIDARDRQDYRMESAHDCS